MASRMIDLKRAPAKGGKGNGNGKGLPMPGAQSDYPPDAAFHVSGDHAKKLFGDSLPAPHTKVKFRGHGEVRNAGASYGDEDHVHIQMHKLHVAPHEDDEEEGGDEDQPKKALRNTIKRSARQVGEDLGDEEE